MRKNPKIIKIAKSYVKEIKYLQVLIFAKSDFFSRPAPPRCDHALFSKTQLFLCFAQGRKVDYLTQCYISI